MKIAPTFIQTNCVEGNRIDLRQAQSVLKHRPDMIFFEFPAGKNGPDTIFNKYPADKKPLKKVDALIARLRISALEYPYALSDVAVWENIKQLWAEGHNVLLYNVDAPDALRRAYKLEYEMPYPQARKDWLFWAYLYLRDVSMAKNVTDILSHHKGKNSPLIAVFIQSIHWEHVEFLMGKPSKANIFQYYFGKFPEIHKHNLEDNLKKRNPFMYKWWVRLAHKLIRA